MVPELHPPFGQLAGEVIEVGSEPGSRYSTRAMGMILSFAKESRHWEWNMRLGFDQALLHGPWIAAQNNRFGFGFPRFARLMK